MTRSVRSLALAAAIALAAPAVAGPAAQGLNSEVGLPACDDCFSAPVMTGFVMDVFGTTRNVLFVLNNGYVIFDDGERTFTPTGLGAGYAGLPIIAPFFADVDTRSGLGTMTFGTGTFVSRPAWGANRLDTGYSNLRGDKRNSFQLILTGRSDVGAGDFDIYFNDCQIPWETKVRPAA